MYNVKCTLFTTKTLKSIEMLFALGAFQCSLLLTGSCSLYHLTLVPQRASNF